MLAMCYSSFLMSEFQQTFLSRFFEPVSDAEPMGLGTRTFTDVRSEDADSDVHSSLALGTRTFTHVHAEDADVDPARDSDPDATEFGPWVGSLV